MWKFWRNVQVAGPVVVGAVFAVALLLPAVSWPSLSLHAAVEAAGGVAAIQLAALLALIPAKDEIPPTSRLAPGLAAMGTFDLFHAASEPGPLFVWLNVLATLTGGGWFLLAWTRGRLPLRGVTLLAIAGAGVSAAVFHTHPAWVPKVLDGDRYTPLANALHVLAASGFFLSVPALLRPSHARELVLGVMAALLGLAALLFPLSEPWNLQWWFWHGVRLLGYQLAFGVVVERVRRSHEELEREVARRTEQLRHAVRDLESFSYTVSHDLRAPLRVIEGYTGLMLADGPLDPSVRVYVDRVGAATRRMRDLIEDLLHLSRASPPTLDRESVDLSALAAQSLAELRSTAPTRSVDVYIEPGLVASADPGLLRIALDNLLSNAWKFTSRCTDARIEVGKELVSGEPAFYVRDNGAGFDMAEVGRLFVPFERLHSQGVYAGIGIGLATVRRIVERHGGRVWAEGAPGEGATFWFTLPTP